MAVISEEFGHRMKEELERRGWSYQRACVASGVPTPTIGRMALGIVPGKDHIINWAVAIQEPINEWLVLAGYDPIPEELVCRHNELSVPTLLRAALLRVGDELTEDDVSALLAVIEKAERRRKREMK